MAQVPILNIISPECVELLQVNSSLNKTQTSSLSNRDLLGSLSNTKINDVRIPNTESIDIDSCMYHISQQNARSLNNFIKQMSELARNHI